MKFAFALSPVLARMAVALLILSAPFGVTANPAEEVSFRVEAGDGSLVGGVMEWTIIETASEDITVFSGNALAPVSLLPGRYEVIVVSGDLQAEAPIEVEPGGQNAFVLTMASGAPAYGFESPSSVPAGGLLQFSWQGPNNKKDVIFVAELGLADTRYVTNRNLSHQASVGAPGQVVAPAEPGDYEIRYLSMESGSVLFRQPLTVTEPQISWQSPSSVVAATEFEVSVTGPGASGDLVFVASADMPANGYFREAHRVHRVDNGSVGRLVAPAEPGSYELRYFSGANGTMLAAHSIEVSPHNVVLKAPRTVRAGESFDVEWSGPGAQGDFLTLMFPDDAPNQFRYGSRQKSVTAGSPVSFVAPDSSGAFEIRYFSKANGTMVAKRAILVRGVETPSSQPYGITWPTGWKLRQGQLPGGSGDVPSVGSRSVASVSDEGGRQAQMGVVHKLIDANMSASEPLEEQYLNEFLAGAVGDFIKSFEKKGLRASDVKESRELLAGLPARKSRVALSGGGHEQALEVIVVATQRDAFIVYFTGDKATVDQYRADYQASLDTFTLK
jgi:hypothetical protein